jgi:dethiobiotin synthetase
MRKIFVTGIGTGVGKTVISAILVEKLRADYWKPVQSGDTDDTDTMKVKDLVANSDSVFHREAYTFKNPLSPHHASKLEGVAIDPKEIVLPELINDTVIIEGAGGLMVPLNNDYLMIDLIKDLNAEVILVADFYLGSINHTLLSCLAIRQRNLPFLGIIFNGNSNPESEDVILKFSGAHDLGRIPKTHSVNKDFIREAAFLIDIE